MGRLQGLIKESNCADPVQHSELATVLHIVMCQRHYDGHAADLWWKREVPAPGAGCVDFTPARRADIIGKRRELIEHIEAQNADRAAETIERHVAATGRHLVE